MAAHTIGRSLRNLRHRCDQQVHSMDGNDSPDSDPILSFDRHVSSLLLSLLDDADVTSFLSVPWIGKLLRSFLLLLDDFNALLLPANSPNCPLLKRLLSDFSDRSVKALDLLNAVSDGLDRVRRCSAQLDIVVPAVAGRKLHRAKNPRRPLPPPPPDRTRPGQPQPVLQPRPEPPPPGPAADRPLLVRLPHLVGRKAAAGHGEQPGPPEARRHIGHRGARHPDIHDELGAAVRLVGAGRRRPVPGPGAARAPAAGPEELPVGRGDGLAAGEDTRGAQEEEGPRRERTDEGDLRDREGDEELLDRTQGEKEVEVRVRELEEVREGLKEGLEPLERQVREVFHRIVQSRTEGLDCSSQSSRQ